MKDYRIIEITDGCMNGDSALYLTSAPDEEIKELCEQYREDDQTDFRVLATRYFFRLLVGSDEISNYQEVRENFNVTKTFTIF